MTENNREGYWFAANDYLPHGDGRKVEPGKSLTVTGKLVLCRNGLHYSCHPFDALTYATGFNLWKVKALGELLVDNDKCCTSERLHIQKVDVKETVLLFARKQALKVLHLWNAPEIVKKFLNTGENAADAAAYAAYAAAYAAYAAAYAAYAAYAGARQEFKEMIEVLFA